MPNWTVSKSLTRSAASFNPRMLRRIATGARDTLLTATDADRRNSPLNSRARISDGSGIRFFVVSGKIWLDGSTRYDASEQSNGSDFDSRESTRWPPCYLSFWLHYGGDSLSTVTGTALRPIPACGCVTPRGPKRIVRRGYRYQRCESERSPALAASLDCPGKVP
jgi:hypothetical protein